MPMAMVIFGLKDVSVVLYESSMTVCEDSNDPTRLEIKEKKIRWE